MTPFVIDQGGVNAKNITKEILHPTDALANKPLPLCLAFLASGLVSEAEMPKSQNERETGEAPV